MNDDLFGFCDSLGPSKIVHLHVPSAGLKGIVVVDNVATGPAIGGMRMAPDVGAEECYRLARAMTFKNAVAGLPHGGAKSVILADPAMPPKEKEQLIRAFACAIRNLTDYIPGPDMGTDETAMAWVRDEIGRSVGLPREVGGIPLDEIGATGFGLAAAAEVAQDFCDVEVAGARVAIQGFGAVGKHTARFLVERGAVLVGASDSRGTITNPDGIDICKLIEFKQQHHSLADYPDGQACGREEIISVPCEILVPAARPDVIREDNVNRLNCKMVLQGANIPATEAAEAKLHERGVLCVPDIIANAGGVICASVEYHGGTEATALAMIEERLRYHTRQVLEIAKQKSIMPRVAAVELAEARIRRAMSLARWS